MRACCGKPTTPLSICHLRTLNYTNAVNVLCSLCHAAFQDPKSMYALPGAAQNTLSTSDARSIRSSSHPTQPIVELRRPRPEFPLGSHQLETTRGDPGRRSRRLPGWRGAPCRPAQGESGARRDDSAASCGAPGPSQRHRLPRGGTGSTAASQCRSHTAAATGSCAAGHLRLGQS